MPLFLLPPSPYFKNIPSNILKWILSTWEVNGSDPGAPFLLSLCVFMVTNQPLFIILELKYWEYVPVGQSQLWHFFSSVCYKFANKWRAEVMKFSSLSSHKIFFWSYSYNYPQTFIFIIYSTFFCLSFFYEFQTCI